MPAIFHGCGPICCMFYAMINSKCVDIRFVQEYIDNSITILPI